MPKEQNDMYNNQTEEKITNDVAQQRILWKRHLNKIKLNMERNYIKLHEDDSFIDKHKIG